MAFKDHFSRHAESYAVARPDYPRELFEYLSGLCNSHRLAWDCATGNGQAAQALATYFDQVIATDASQAQLNQATPGKNIHYRQCSAEQAALDSGSADIVAVAQALHWFDTELFFHNVNRVLKSGGILAVWSYGQLAIDSVLNRAIMKLYDNVLGEYWPPERRLVERCYADIEFPFTRLSTPNFRMSQHWSYKNLVDYLMSWSATRRYIRRNGKNPLDLVVDELAAAWGSENRREIVWPLTVKVCRK